MKNRFKIVLLALILMTSFGCEEVDKLTQFTMSFNNQVTIPGSAVLGVPISVATPSVATNSEAKFKQNETNAASIDEINLQKMTLSVISPANGDFDFFESVEVFMSAGNLPEVSLGSANNIALGLTELPLTTTGANIKDYITKSEFSIRVATTTDETISSDHEINVNTVFFVDAKILGQ